MTAALLTLGTLVIGIPLLIWADKDAHKPERMSNAWCARQASMERHQANGGKP